MRLFLSIAALVPAVFLAWYIYKKDAREKEPARLLVKLAVAGVVIILPVVLVEMLFGGIFTGIFTGAARFGFGEVVGDQVALSPVVFALYQLLQNFIGVALVEEGFKWLAVRLLTAKNPNFNSLFDGIIYCVFVSLGFAAAENVKYVLSYGFSTAVVRAITAVPGHMFFAVFMGVWYAEWHITAGSREMERRFALEERIPIPNPSRFDPKRANVMSLLLPVAVHGLYDFLLSFDSPVFTVIFYVYLALLYFICFRLIRSRSAEDALSARLSLYRVFQAYPGLEEEMRAEELARQARLDAERAAGIPGWTPPARPTGQYSDPEARRAAEAKYGDVFAHNGSSVGYRPSDAYVEAEKRRSFVEKTPGHSFVEHNPGNSTVTHNPNTGSLKKRE